MAAPSVKVSGYERAGGVVVSEYERAPPGSKRDGQQESTRDDQQQQQQGTKREAETPDRDAEDKPAADAPSENQRKRPTLTVEQYLAMSLAEQQEELVRRAVGNDPEKVCLTWPANFIDTLPAHCVDTLPAHFVDTLSTHFVDMLPAHFVDMLPCEFHQHVAASNPMQFAEISGEQRHQSQHAAAAPAWTQHFPC